MASDKKTTCSFCDRVLDNEREVIKSEDGKYKHLMCAMLEMGGTKLHKPDKKLKKDCSEKS